MEDTKPLLSAPLYPELQPPQYSYPVQPIPQQQNQTLPQQPQQNQTLPQQPQQYAFLAGPPPLQICPFCQMMLPMDQYQQHFCSAMNQQWMQQNQQILLPQYTSQQQPLYNTMQPQYTSQQQPLYNTMQPQFTPAPVNSGYPGGMGNSSQPQSMPPPVNFNPPPVNPGYPGGMGNSSLNNNNGVNDNSRLGLISASGEPYSVPCQKAPSQKVVVKSFKVAPKNNNNPKAKQACFTNGPKNYTQAAKPFDKKFPILLQTSCAAMNGNSALGGTINVSKQHVNFVAAHGSSTIIVTIPWDTVSEVKLVSGKILIYTHDNKVHTFFGFKGDFLKKTYDMISTTHYKFNH